MWASRPHWLGVYSSEPSLRHLPSSFLPTSEVALWSCPPFLPGQMSSPRYFSAFGSARRLQYHCVVLRVLAPVMH